MNLRSAQDIILRLLADAPFRAQAFARPDALDPEAAHVVAHVDAPALDRFARFLCRHYYRERIVHFFKYSRALASRTGRVPEAVLKTNEFNALMPRLVLGERASAQLVLDLLRRRLLEDGDAVRAGVPYWEDLVDYQSFFFLSDAAPAPAASSDAAPFPARSESAILLDFQWDLPAVLPNLLRPFIDLPMPPRKPITLLFARSPQGEVTVLRSTDALKQILTRLTGREDPAQIAAQLNLDPASMAKAMKRLEEIGAVVAQESFSSSHVGSDLPLSSANRTA